MRSRMFAGAAIAAALVLTACSGGGNEGGGGGDAGPAEIDPDGTFRYIFVQNPSTLDPHRSANAWDMIFFRLAFDQLIYQTPTGELEPMLATDWEFVDDDTALEMNLRDDVDFIDGEHFNAETVVANIERALTLEESVHKGSLARIDSVEAVEEYKVRFNLNGPGGNLPSLFSSTAGSMMSPASFENEDVDQNPVGSGMAKLIEYVPGSFNRWERNDDYWDPDAAKAKYYEIHVQTSSPTRVNMLQSGQGELTYLMPQDEDPAKQAGLNVAPSISTNYFSLSLNANKPGLKDPRVRQALEHAIDREALVNGVFFGAGAPIAQSLTPGYWAYDPDVTPDNPEYGYDPEKAKELLAEAGFADGLDLEMLIPSLDDHRAIGEAMVPMFAAVGINVSTRVIESPTTGITFFGEQQGDMVPGMSAPITDPTNTYQGNLPNQFANPSNNTSDEFIAAWGESLQGATQDERLPGIYKMIEEAKKLDNNIPLMMFTPPSAWSKNVVFPEDYPIPAYAPHFRGIGVTK